MAYNELLEEIDRLPASDKWQLVKHVLDTLEQEQSSPAPQGDYQEFLREMYGVLSDTPITRGEQGDYEAREPLE